MKKIQHAAMSVLLGTLLSSCSTGMPSPSQQPDNSSVDSRGPMKAIQTRALVLPDLVAFTALREVIGERNVSIAGLQYYLAGGTGGINFLARPVDVNGFEQIFKQELEGRARKLATTGVGLFQREQNDVTAQASLNEYLFILDNRINQIEASSLDTPTIYAIYLHGDDQQVNEIASMLNTIKIDDVEDRLLNRYTLNHVVEQHNHFYKSLNISAMSNLNKSSDIINKYIYKYNIDISETKMPYSEQIETQSYGTWWPAGHMQYLPRNSYYGGHVADVDFVFAWGTTRLNNLKNIRSGIYNLDAFEIDFNIYSPSNLIYSACSSYNSMPYAYDDCFTSDVFETGYTSYGFGTFDNNFLNPNWNYDANITLYGSGTYPQTGYLMRTNLGGQAVHCYTLSIWVCGLNRYEKVSSIMISEFNMNMRFNQRYSQSWQ